MMIKTRVKDKLKAKLEETYEIVLYDENSDRDINIGALRANDYKKYLPIAIKDSISQKEFWLFILNVIKLLFFRFLFSFSFYLIISVLFVFFIGKLDFNLDNLLSIVNHEVYILIAFFFAFNAFIYYLFIVYKKFFLYINREITKLYLKNSIFNKTDYNYENIYLIKKLKFK